VRADEICQLVLRTCKAEGVADAVVAVTQSENTMVRFSNNQITVMNALQEASAFIYVADSGRKAGTNVADLSKRTLVNTSKKIVESAKRGPAGDVTAPLPKGPFNYEPTLLENNPVPMEAKKLVSYVKEGIDAALGQGAERVAGSLIADNSRVTLQTSAGAFGVTKKSSLELSLRAFQSSLASGHAVRIAGSEQDFRPSEAGEEAGRMAVLAKDPVNIEPGQYKAVLGPLVFADLVQHTGRMASAFSVDAGFSFLTGKMGQKVCSEQLTVCDDATMPGAYGSYAFDSEGLPTRRTAIIEKGVLKSYLHNSATAKKFGVESTANAGLVAPHAFNLTVDAGTRSVDELIRSVDKGIYVTNNWYLRYQNMQTGDFSTIPRDAMFLIENGQIGKSIKEMRISDNVLRILSDTSALSTERKWIKWWEVEIPVLAPTALVNDLRFTRSRM